MNDDAWRGRNNLRAEAHRDQMLAGNRDGEPTQPHELDAAAAARTIDVKKLPPSLRDSANSLLDKWAEDAGVERPDQ